VRSVIGAKPLQVQFRLPIEWFERRHVGDILSRFQSIGLIKELLTQGAVAALTDEADVKS